MPGSDAAAPRGDCASGTDSEFACFDEVIICAVLAVVPSLSAATRPSGSSNAWLRVRRLSRETACRRMTNAVEGASGHRIALKLGLRLAFQERMLLWAVLLESALLAGVIVGVLGLIHWKDRKKRLPFTQKILRPPGESLRVRLAELDEKLNDRLVQLLLSAYSPLLMAGLAALQGVRITSGIMIFFAGIAVLASTCAGYSLWKLLGLRRRCRLGYEGERHAGEALNQLMLAGYRVFHDFLITDKPGVTWNIDHIVIGSNGVFAVETKTRRKVKGLDGAKVIIGEDRLEYPWGADRCGLDQARDNAAWLSDWISKTFERPIKAAPLLVLPGWFIDRRCKLPVTVLSGREVTAQVPKLNGTRLTSDEISRIAAMIEDRNRSVEY